MSGLRSDEDGDGDCGPGTIVFTASLHIAHAAIRRLSG
jgi:hypothetical protein